MGSQETVMPNYLCFTALEAGTFTFTIPTGFTYLTDFEWSINGISWTKLVRNSETDVISATPIINKDDKVYLRATSSSLYNSDTNRLLISSTCDFDIEGNLLSLLYSKNFVNYNKPSITSQHTFHRLFAETNVVDASKLIWGIGNFTNDFGCQEMFLNCTKLTTPPAFEITQGRTGVYLNMYKGCTSLETMPDIEPLINGTFSNRLFEGMFYGCTNLKYSPKTYTISGNKGFINMFRDCASLEISPIAVLDGLSADARFMFAGCTKLINAPTIICTSSLKSYAYQEIFEDCTSLKYLKMLIVNYSATAMLNWVRRMTNTTDFVFVKHIDATWTNTGNSGTLTNWKVIYYDATDDKYYTDKTKTTECDDNGNPI